MLVCPICGFTCVPKGTGLDGLEISEDFSHFPSLKVVNKSLNLGGEDPSVKSIQWEELAARVK